MPQVIGSETVFRGKVFNVRKDRVQLDDGPQVTLDIVEHRGAITLVPLDESGQIWFIRQYRHPAGENLLELPAGVMEKGEPAEVTAQREIREEIGMAAEKVQKLGEFFLAPGYSTEYMHVYLATGLHASPLPGDEDEQISVVKVPAAQAFHMAEAGEIRDAKSLAALLLARRFL